MEEKLLDKITKQYLDEYYLNQNYKKCLSKSIQVYRLFERINNKDTKDKFYIWITLITIVRCYFKLNEISRDNQIEINKSYKYILLSIRYSNSKDKEILSYQLLSEYYKIINNDTKCQYYNDIVREYNDTNENNVNIKGNNKKYDEQYNVENSTQIQGILNIFK